MRARLSAMVFAVWFAAVTLVICLTAWAELFVRRPAPGPESWAIMQRVTRRWSRLVLGSLHPLCGIDWRVEGAWPGTGAALLALQHQSTFETLLVMASLPSPAVVLKRELADLPLFGPLTRRAGMIVVDRGAGAVALRHMLRDAEVAWAAGRQVVIFPEGTRVAPGDTATLHPGVAALAARVPGPVIPVVTDSGRRWGRTPFDKRPGTIRIGILEPLPPGLPRAELLGRLAQLYQA